MANSGCGSSNSRDFVDCESEMIRKFLLENDELKKRVTILECEMESMECNYNRTAGLNESVVEYMESESKSLKIQRLEVKVQRLEESARDNWKNGYAAAKARYGIPDSP